MIKSKSSEISKYIELFQQKYNNMLHINETLQFEKQEFISKKEKEVIDCVNAIRTYNNNVGIYETLVSPGKTLSIINTQENEEIFTLYGGQPQQYQKFVPVITTILINKMIDNYNKLKDDNQNLKTDIENVNSDISELKIVTTYVKDRIKDVSNEINSRNDSIKQKITYVPKTFKKIPTITSSTNMYTFKKDLETSLGIPFKVAHGIELTSLSDWTKKFVEISENIGKFPDEARLIMSLIGVAGIISYYKNEFEHQIKGSFVETNEQQRIAIIYQNVNNGTINDINQSISNNKMDETTMKNILITYNSKLNTIGVPETNELNISQTILIYVKFAYGYALNLLNASIKTNKSTRNLIISLIGHLNNFIYDVNYDSNNANINDQFLIIYNYICKNFSIFMFRDASKFIINLYQNVYVLNDIVQLVSEQQDQKVRLKLFGDYKINYFVQIVNYMLNYCYEYYVGDNTEYRIPIDQMLRILNLILLCVTKKESVDDIKTTLDNESNEISNTKNADAEFIKYATTLIDNIIKNIKLLKTYFKKNGELDLSYEATISNCMKDIDTDKCKQLAIPYNDFVNELANAYLYKINTIANQHILKSTDPWFHQKILFYKITSIFDIPRDDKAYNAIKMKGELYEKVSEENIEIYNLNVDEIVILNNIFLIVGNKINDVVYKYLDMYYNFKLSNASIHKETKTVDDLSITDGDKKTMENNDVLNNFMSLYNGLIDNIDDQSGGNNKEVLKLWNDALTNKVALTKEDAEKVLNTINILLLNLPESVTIKIDFNMSKSKIDNLLKIITDEKGNIINMKDFPEKKINPEELMNEIFKKIDDPIKTYISQYFMENNEPHITSNDTLDAQWVVNFSNIVDNNQNQLQPETFYAMLTMIGIIGLDMFVQKFRTKINLPVTTETTSLSIHDKNVSKPTSSSDIINLWTNTINKKAGFINSHYINNLIESIQKLLNKIQNNQRFEVDENHYFIFYKDGAVSIMQVNYTDPNVNISDFNDLSSYVNILKENTEIIINSYKKMNQQGGSYNYEHKYKKYKLKYINYKNNM